jgi:hypothetical protein
LISSTRERERERERERQTERQREYPVDAFAIICWLNQEEEEILENN